jgi:hypothetical protein
VVGRRGSIAPRDQTREEINIAVARGEAGSQRTVIEGYELIQTDEFVHEGSIFEAGDRRYIGRTVDLALPTRYDAIAINAWVLVARRDDVRISRDISRPAQVSWDEAGSHEDDAPLWVADAGTDFMRYDVPIDETSYLREQTRQKWTGSVWRVLAPPSPTYAPGNYLEWRFATADSPLDVGPDTVDSDNRTAAERYGIAWSETGLFERSAYSLKIKEP